MTLFEYDEAKRLANLEKHGIDFLDCIEVFSDRRSFEIRSDRDGEPRCLLIGALKGRVIAVIFTLRGENIRLISARKAREREVALWLTDPT
ncbi:MAG: BrnT family toxin [Beijerinckiaceae bacterium]|nr:BrnT family toxin [Beijerinckiaceae bacterium]